LQVLLALWLLLCLLLAFPFVQTKLGNYATNFLQEEFDVSIRIQKVDLSLFGNVKFKKVFIQDHHLDTLILAENINSSLLSFVNIANNKLEFNHIELNEFALYIKTYQGEDDDGLSIFIDKFGKSKDGDPPSSFRMSADALKLSEGYVEIVDENKESDIPIFFKKIKGKGKDFKIVGPNVNVSIRDFSFIENHGIEAKSFSSEFEYTKTAMRFLNTELETETSNLLADIIFTYERENLSDFNNKVNIEGELKKADVSLIDLKKFYNEIGTKDVIHLTTLVSGQLNNLDLVNLQLKSDKGAIVEGDINLKNSFNTENGFSLNADLDNLVSDYYQLITLLPNVLGNSLPDVFKDFGRFKIKGKTYVTDNVINAKVEINTDIGSTIADVELTNIQNIEYASYVGTVDIVDFELGKMANDSLIGQLSMKAEIDGEGFTLENLNTSINGVVSKHQYKNYTYSNISLNGIVKNKHFNGEMEVNDDNIKLNFNGLADLSSEIYKFDFKTTVDYCDLFKLNLFKRDSISNLKGRIEINLTGNSLDNISGAISFKNSLYINEKDNYFFNDFAIESTFKDSIRTITINSPEIVEGEIKGKFKFSELGKLFQNSIGSNYINYKPYKVGANQYLSFSLEVYNKIIEVFLPEVILSANTFIRGNLDSDKSLFKLNIKSPKIIAFSNTIDSLNLQVDNKNPLFNTQLIVNKISSKMYEISDMHLVNKTLNDTLYFGTNFKGGKNKSEQFDFAFYHTFNENNKSVIGIQKSNVQFKGNKWTINPKNDAENKLIIDSKAKTYTFSPFLVTSNTQSIDFYGVIKDTISKDFKFSFKDVNLSDITPDIDSLDLNGLVNGSINYTQQKNQIKPTVNLLVSGFKINDSEQGNLDMKIEGKNSVTDYILDMSLVRGDKTSFSAFGDIKFSTASPSLDIKINFDDFKLDAFSPLGEDVFNKIRGYAFGDIRVTGLVENPIMKGVLYLDDAGLYFPYLNVDYDFVGRSIVNLDNQAFTFEKVKIKDKDYNTTGELVGSINHDHFKVWNLDLKIESDNLLVLNAKEQETSIYYGTAFFDGLATIKGSTDKLIIDVNGKTNKGTHFVLPLSDVRTAESSQLIHFINIENEEEKEELRKAFISEKLKGLSMNLDLEVTKEAVFEMVIDKSSGSNLQGSGTGNLQIELDTKDKFEMYGDFEVDRGIYNFKYGGIISKPFTVRKGGTISWSGDPLTAEIDIEAIHRVTANPKSLLENISTNRKIPVDLVTRFSGELFDSDIEFDFEIPHSSSTVASELEFKINDNKTIQFISLLVTGTFYNEENQGLNSNAALYGTGVDLLTGAFDNILNSPDSKFKLTPVYTVGEKNNIEKYNIDDELALAMDYQVNDRIIINGKVGVPIGTETTASVVGEVNIEFLMNETGTLRSSVFNRQNDIQYTEEEEGYTQGIGLNYQIDFENGGELLQKMGLKKNTKKDSTNYQKKKDTIYKNELIKFKNNTENE